HCGLSLAALTLILSSCGTFGQSDEERRRLTLYQQNAANFYEGQKFNQALAEVDKGLEIDPDDYRLHSIAAWCYLRSARGNAQLLAQSEQEFDKLYAMRPSSKHGAPVLLGYALCKQRLGIMHHARAQRLREEAAGRDLDDEARATRSARAIEHENMYRSYFQDADRVFQRLIARGESLRLAYKHSMEISVLEGDYVGAVEEGNLCLQRIEAEKRYQSQIISETMSVAREREERLLLQDLINQESRVRSALAEMHYRKKNYQLAVEQLNLLLSADPNRANDYYNRARALEALEERERAHRDYQKFLTITDLPMGDARVKRAFEFSRQFRGQG
ncbi:MAG: tetratricopeptide repeat protein, partial [Planctomycetota bacterium]